MLLALRAARQPVNFDVRHLRLQRFAAEDAPDVLFAMQNPQHLDGFGVSHEIHANRPESVNRPGAQTVQMGMPLMKKGSHSRSSLDRFQSVAHSLFETDRNVSAIHSHQVVAELPNNVSPRRFAVLNLQTRRPALAELSS